ncbi:MAG TPA: hypothetical protein VMT37_08225 [Solirubrobacterales bacterium]|nr:hypothetical protein [Solirubrobacterales bacterium]
MLALVLVGAAGVLTGCGGDEGVAAGATVRVYVEAALCPGAERALTTAGGEAGDLRVRAVCLPPVEGAALGSRRVKLAVVGSNARRATQDSSSVAYLEPPGPANRFAEPILEEPGIAFVKSSSGARAMRNVLSAVEEAGSGSGSIRDEVRKTLESG